MKKFKKMMALLIAMVMVLAMGVPASAAPKDVTLKVPEGNYTYEIYQIFTGELADGVLSNIHWGENGTEKEGELVDSETLEKIESIDGTDAEKAALLKKYANFSSPYAEVQGGKEITVKTGYYLIKDKDNVPLGDGEEHTLYILAVVDDTTIERKADTTSSSKTVDDKNDSELSSGELNAENGTSSDYDIGDEVPYHVTATISDSVGQYPKYHITIEDILEDGKFDDIKLNEQAITLGDGIIDNTEDYTVEARWDKEPSKSGFKVTYEFTPKAGHDLSSLAGKKIVIDFTATLGQGAAIGAAGNKNTLKVSYSNNPNEEDGRSEGKTPDKEVITFTYKVVVNKFDEEQQPLEGAEFTLYKVSKEDAEAGVIGTDAAEKNKEWATKQIQTWITTATAGANDKKNCFSFDGIDDGYYVLCETVTPAGYNTLEPQVFKITATHEEMRLTELSGDPKSGTITFTPNKEDGSLSTNVTNNKGSTLPSTGGIGTTIFYVIGAVLVIGAGVLLVTRKRMANK